MKTLNVHMVTFSLFLGVIAPSSGQDKISDKAQAIIAALEKILPEHERTATELEGKLKPLAESKKPQTAVAADAVRLQTMSIHSIRKIIAQAPEYLVYHIGPGNLPRWQEGAEYFLKHAEAGSDAFGGMVSGVRPYRSKIDGQLLLYKFTLPKKYDPAQRYPLRVHLHAGAGFTWLAYWVTGKPNADTRTASNDDAIHITPAGRQHVGMGEIAVLEALADARKHYAIDADRVTIGGASWGGTGGFHFATLLPDHFAAAHSLTGGGNYAVPVGNGRFDAYILGDNLCNLPFLIWDTPGDGHYKANHAFADGLRERAKLHPGHYPHLELTDPKGGHGVIDRKLLDEGWAWLDKQQRNRFPTLVIYKTHCLRYDGAYWARIDTVEDPSKPARIEAQINDTGIRVMVDNVDRFHLDLGEPLKGATININGTTCPVPAGKIAYFWKSEGKWSVAPQRYPAGLLKKHGMSGPIQDVFMEHPVLLVHGAASNATQEATHQKLDAMTQRLFGARDGSGFLHNGLDRKADSAVSDEDIQQRNLILVGTPQQNRLLAKLAGKLPVTFTDDGISLAGKEHRGTDVSLVMVYPNPLNPERYILLMPEIYVGEKTWDYPDYLIMRAGKDGRRPTILDKGNFDARWQLPK